MRTYATARLAGYAGLVVAGLIGGLAAGRPEPIILAAPFALWLAVGLSITSAPRIHLRVNADATRVVEGDDVHLTVTGLPADAQAAPLVPPGLSLIESTATPGGATRFTFRAERWGAYRLSPVTVRQLDAFGLLATEATFDAGLSLRVHPRPERLNATVSAVDLQPYLGHHRSRAIGDGLEFADLRPFATGDRARNVNWRASARRGDLWVNERHPERSGDVVVLLDTAGLERADRATALDAAVHTVSAVAAAYERRRDRIGLLTFGGHLRWLPLGTGRRQLHRLVDALLDTELLISETWAGAARVPIGGLPPRALLLAFTALDTDEASDTLLDLRSRAFDVAVVITPPAPDTGVRPAERLGGRIDALLRDARRLRLERLGVAVASAALPADIPAALRELELARRRVRSRT